MLNGGGKVVIVKEAWRQGRVLACSLGLLNENGTDEVDQGPVSWISRWRRRDRPD